MRFYFGLSEYPCHDYHHNHVWAYNLPPKSFRIEFGLHIDYSLDCFCTILEDQEDMIHFKSEDKKLVFFSALPTGWNTGLRGIRNHKRLSVMRSYCVSHEF